MKQTKTYLLRGLLCAFAATLAVLLQCCAAGKHVPKAPNNITIVDTVGLRIYYPNYTRIDLVCETMPSPDDDSVLMCCEAAFTGKLLDEFQHSNIAGNHVSGGVKHNGYTCAANTGCFAYYADKKTWQFAVGDDASLIDKAARHGGMAFGQTMIIRDNKDIHNGLPLKDTREHCFRALCEINGKLCIADSKAVVSYKDFIQMLLKAGATHALYLDMGGGWNYSFYRDNADTVKFIHQRRIKYTTNWITFYR